MSGEYDQPRLFCGKTAQESFREAVSRDNFKQAADLIGRDDVDVDELDAGGTCAVHDCCMYGQRWMLSLLLSRGASVSTKVSE